MRRFKQLTYALLFGAVIFGLGYLMYGSSSTAVPSCFDNKQNQNEEDTDCGGPCISCEVKRLKSIDASARYIFRAGDGIGYAVQLANPNTGWGALSFGYQITFLDKFGSPLGTTSGSSFIYPGEVKYIVEPRIQATWSKDVAALDVALQNPQWTPEAQMQRVKLELQEVRTVKEAQLFVKGKVISQGENAFSRLALVALVFNKNGTLLGASKTELSSLEKFGPTPFKIGFSPELSLYTPQVTASITFTRTFVLGDTGEDVQNLQGVLAELGYYKDAVTGFFDSSTADALKQFQRAESLQESGNFDDVTKEAIQKLLQDRTPQQSVVEQDKAVDPLKTKVFIEVRK